MRLRIDQSESLAELMAQDPELDKAELIRKGIDLEIARRRGEIRIMPTAPIFQNT